VEELLAGLDPTVPLPVALLTVALDALADLDPVELDPDTALRVAASLLTASDRVRVAALRSVADVDTRDLWALDGAPSTGTWVADQPASMPRSEVTLAKRLDAVPQVAAAIAAGTLSIDDGVLVQQALSRLRRHVDRPDGRIDGQDGEQALHGVIVNGVTLQAGATLGGLADDDPRIVALHGRLQEIWSAPLPQTTRLESAFVQLTGWMSGDLLRRALGQLVDALLPNELEQRSQEAENNRGITIRRHHDRSGGRLTADLDDEGLELVETSLKAALAADPDNPADTAAAADLRARGLDPYDPDLTSCDRPRSKAQRLHDALKLLLRKTLDSGALGSTGKQPVRIGVTIPLAALHGQPGALPAVTDNGHTIPASLVRRWLCDSAITRFVLSLGNRVLASSHTDRTLKPHERRIKQIETGGICQGAGCNRGDPTGHVLIPHHVTAYARCGTTSLDDTVMLCEPSHNDVHAGGKTLRLKDGRRLNEAGWVG
jgi:hypothetical protein